jgi:hypothetical protein
MEVKELVFPCCRINWIIGERKDFGNMFSWKKVIRLQFPYNVFHSLNYAIIAAEDIENGINNLSLRRV